MKKQLSSFHAICLFMLISCIAGCPAKKDKSDKTEGMEPVSQSEASTDESRSFEPVTQSEAEAFANQMIAEFNQGDKTQFINAGTDADALVAYMQLSGEEIPDFLKNSSEHERFMRQEIVAGKNRAVFDSLKSVELAGIEEKGGSFCVILDCKFDKSDDKKIPFHLLKMKTCDNTKSTIVVAGVSIEILQR